MTVYHPDHNHPYMEFTRSLCSICHQVIDAAFVEQGGSVYLKKRCPEHGLHFELFEEDVNWFRQRYDFVKAATRTAPDTELQHGCPYDCGLCPDHEQHTCITVLEVTNACDLDCTVCYANSGVGRRSFLSLETAMRMLEHVKMREPAGLEILQISGGEPCLHPDLLHLIRAARAQGFKHVMLNTNGMRIAADREFAKALSEFETGFEVYLQYDGVAPETLTRMRPNSTARLKERALATLSEFNIPTTLAATVEAGVNDGCLAPIIQTALDMPCVRGVNFQPLAFFGRRPEPLTANRLTISGILKRIEEQTSRLIRMDDFVPLPCNPDRIALNYLLRHSGKFVPVTRELDIRRYLEFIDNTFAFNLADFERSTGQRLLERLQGDCCGFASWIRDLIPAGFLSHSGSEKVRFVAENTFRISVSSFVDAHNFDMRSMKRECVHVITPDLKRIPFSAWNMLHREAHGERAFT